MHNFEDINESLGIPSKWKKIKKAHLAKFIPLSTGNRGKGIYPWTDPSFDSNNPAVYYVRVLEIETPRWTTYDAARFGVDLPKDVPVTIKERAYTSPIWYTP